MPVSAGTAFLDIEPRLDKLEQQITKGLGPAVDQAAKKSSTQMAKTLEEGGKAAGVGMAAGIEAGATKSGSALSSIATKGKAAFGTLSSVANTAGLGMNPVVGALSGVDTALRSVDSTASRASKALLGVGVGAAGVGAVLTRMGDDSRRATAQLQLAIENAGGSFDVYERRIGQVSNRMIKLGFDDEAVARSLATLTTATQDPAKALDQMGLAADIARARHISLEAATDKLAKAQTGNTRIFKEFGIELAANASASEKAAAMAELQRRVQGQAAEAANDWTGKLTSLRIQVENVAEAAGEKFGPALTFAGTAAAGLGGISSATGLKVGELVKKIGPTAVGLGAVGLAAGTVFYALGKMNEKVELSQQQLTKLALASEATQMAFLRDAASKSKYGVDVTRIFDQVAATSENSARRMLAALEAQGAKSGLTSAQLAKMRGTLDNLAAGHVLAARDADTQTDAMGNLTTAINGVPEKKIIDFLVNADSALSEIEKMRVAIAHLPSSVLFRPGFEPGAGLEPDYNRISEEYALGGPVKGKPGEPRVAIVHGGEYVLTREEHAAMRAGRSVGVGDSQANANTYEPAQTMSSGPVQLIVDRRVLAEVVSECLGERARSRG